MLLKKTMGIKRWILIAIAAVLVVECLFFCAQAEGIPEAPARSQMIRVALTRLGITDRMDLTLESAYRLTTGSGSSLHFRPGSQISLILREDTIYLYYQDMALDVGNSAILERTQEGGFYRTHFPALYQGDLMLDLADGKLRPVLRMHVEDYLLGVVAYEMNDLFPSEALKAQAIAARTYALRKQNPEAAYDVVDTTNDQVFKGYLPDSPRVEQAIYDTRGVCGFYKGELAQCYYSASNGGQMELVETVWPNSGDFGYYTFGEDPYDVANPQSVVRSFEVKKIYSDPAPYALRKLIAEKAGGLLLEKGWDVSPESVRVDGVSSVRVSTPVEAGNKRMTKLHLSLSISGRTRNEAVQIRLIDADTEEISLFDQPSVTPSPAVQTASDPVETLAPAQTPEIIYSDFIPLETEIELEIPIFPDAEAALGMNISGNYENEIWTVVDGEESFTIEARRYGHGVGMSQRGAQWMAAAHAMDYQNILAFYYPGMQLMRYPEEKTVFVSVEKGLASTAGPAPSPTPRPTLMPVTIEKQEGQWYASVTEIADDSSLNLRATPSLNGTIVMRLYKHQELLVVERCPEDGWVHVRTDTAEGYVMERYLSPLT